MEKKNKFYLGYSIRLIIFILLFFVLFCFACIYCVKSLEFATEEYLNYYENSNINYKVYLKKNEFYSDEYLDMGRTYISSIVDNVGIKFNYNFKSDKNIDMSYNYYITAKLLIQNDSGDNTYYEKEYYLNSIKSENLANNNSYNISEDVDINYDYYNNMANSFQNEYKVSTKNSLVVYLKVSKKDNSGIGINDSSLMSITIPLSQQTMNISTNYTPSVSNSKLINSTKFGIGNMFCFSFAIFLSIISAVSLIKFVKLLLTSLPRKSKYDRVVSKILKEYDSLIITSDSEPEIYNEEINVVNVDEFKELLDVRDNLRLPIMYYVVAEHVKCYFYVRETKYIYLFTVKAVDLEGENEKKK